MRVSIAGSSITVSVISFSYSPDDMAIAIRCTEARRGAMAKAAKRAAAEAWPNRAMGTRVVVTEGRAERLAANLAESPLAWLARRGLVTAAQFAAGERLRDDFHTACLAPRVTMRWDGEPPTRGARGPGEALTPTEAQAAAKRRFEAAVDAAGAGLSDMLWRVVCMGEGLETAERAMGWPARAGKVVLGLALDRLAAHYRIG
jgi:hypothetical protein